MKEAKIPTDLDPVYSHFKYTRPDDCRIVHELRLLVLQGMTAAKSPEAILEIRVNELCKKLCIQTKRLLSILEVLQEQNESTFEVYEGRVKVCYRKLPYTYAYGEHLRVSSAENLSDPDPDPVSQSETRSEEKKESLECLRSLIDDYTWEELLERVGELTKCARPGLLELHVLGYMRQAEKEAKTTKEKALMYWLGGKARPDRPKDEYLRKEVPNHSDSSRPVAPVAKSDDYALPERLRQKSELIRAHLRRISERG